MGDLIHRTMTTGPRSFHCYAGTHGAVIDPRGEVNACEVLSERYGAMGDLREHDMDFQALWSSERAERVRSLVNNHPACRSCTHETMGYVPSLVFPPNRLGYLLGGRARRRAA
jgi:radical SAM protein with 4Fe4S-binding SPASM domain